MSSVNEFTGGLLTVTIARPLSNSQFTYFIIICLCLKFFQPACYKMFANLPIHWITNREFRAHP